MRFPRSIPLALATAMVACVQTAALAQTPGYHLLGVLPGSTASSATALSADGRYAAGSVGVGSTSSAPFVWSEALGRNDFGLNEIPGARLSIPAGISDGGTTVVGEQGNNNAFRWSGPGTFQFMGVLPSNGTQPDHDRSSARGVSGDGSTIVGASARRQSVFGQAFRWTEATGMQPLGFTFPGHVYSEANAISRDGNVIVGMSQSSGGRSDAFRWTAAGGMQALQLPPSATSALASGTNHDGSLVVGYSFLPSGLRTAALWAGDTIQLLTTPPVPIIWRSWATDVSDDGQVVIGILDNNSAGTLPHIWTPAAGWKTPAVYFASQGFALPEGWEVSSLTSLSSDGRTFAGQMFVNDHYEAFVLTIPAPSTLAPLIVLGVASRRRR